MRLTAPRIPPLRESELDAPHRAALAPVAGIPLLNIFATMAQVPEALTAFLAWGSYILSAQNSLAPRAREILILRAGYLCKSGYEFAQHEAIAMRSGLNAQEIDWIKAGADAGWPANEAVLIRAADELVRDHFVSDPTWRALASHYDTVSCMNVVFTVGQYVQVSMMLNTFGIQLEDADALDPDLDWRHA